MKIIGVLLVFGCIFGGFFAAGGKLQTLWQPAEIIMIIGGSFGAFLIANPMSVVKDTGRHISYMTKGSDFNPAYFESLIVLLNTLFEVARKKGGKKILEDHIESPQTSDIFARYPEILKTSHVYKFIIENLRLSLVESMPSNEFSKVVEEEVACQEDEMRRPSVALYTIADALPGFGIAAAVLGIVITMGAINGPAEQLGVYIAAALLGTFLGVFLAYGLVAPFAAAIGHSINNELQAFECIRVSLVNYKAGHPPIIAVDAGRKVLYAEYRPTYAKLEQLIENS